MNKRNKLPTHITIIVFAIITLLIFSISICIGSVYIPLKNVWCSIIKAIFNTNIDIDNIDYSIIINIRLPRTIIAFLTGASLSISGLVMQSILKNPLASSYTLGVSSGASLGAAIVIVFGFSILGSTLYVTPLVAFVFGLATVLLVLAFAYTLDTNMQNNTIILVGMVLSLFVNGILSLISMLAPDYLQTIVFWQMGSFDSANYEQVLVMFPVFIICIIVLIKYSLEMDILTFGEESAMSSGVNVKLTKNILIVITTLLTAISVAFCGTIGFVDLIAPHITRKIFGSSHKKTIPLSVLIGGTFMVIADLISRTVLAPKQIPVGCVTSLIGAPFFAYVYFSKRKKTS